MLDPKKAMEQAMPNFSPVDHVYDAALAAADRVVCEAALITLELIGYDANLHTELDRATIDDFGHMIFGPGGDADARFI